jgi:hypothetical protein
MRAVASLGALLAMAFAVRARAEDAPSPSSLPSPPPPASPPGPPAASPAPPSPPSPSTPDDASPFDAELARQAAAIEELRASLVEERRARENPAVRTSGFIQVDWIAHNQASQDEINGSTGQPLNQDRFTLRRGHLRVDAERGVLHGAIEIDANTTNGPQVRPIDAEVSLRWPEKPDARLPALLVTAGLMRIPFGHEVQELDYVRPFLERATVLQALFPGEFDLGARLAVRYRFLEWRMAAMNGNPIGNKVFPDLDPVQTKDVVGRLGVALEIAPGVRFEAGISADAGTGFHPGTPATGSVLVWQDQNGDGIVEPNEITAIGGTSATASQEFRRWAIAGDARLSVPVGPLGDLSLLTEVVDGQNLDRGLEVADPIGAGHELREVGWYVGATQELTKWAMIGARYDRYDPDRDASQQRALNLVPASRSYSTLALMGMVRYESARLVVEYDSNTNPLGIGANGAPTTLADNALTLRGQLVF